MYCVTRVGLSAQSCALRRRARVLDQESSRCVNSVFCLGRKSCSSSDTMHAQMYWKRGQLVSIDADGFSVRNIKMCFADIFTAFTPDSSFLVWTNGQIYWYSTSNGVSECLLLLHKFEQQWHPHWYACRSFIWSKTIFIYAWFLREVNFFRILE